MISKMSNNLKYIVHKFPRDNWEHYFKSYKQTTDNVMFCLS